MVGEALPPVSLMASPDNKFIHSQWIHGTNGIFTYIWLKLKFMVNVGKYTNPMDPMGLKQLETLACSTIMKVSKN